MAPSRTSRARPIRRGSGSRRDRATGTARAGRRLRGARIEPLARSRRPRVPRARARDRSRGLLYSRAHVSRVRFSGHAAEVRARPRRRHPAHRARARRRSRGAHASAAPPRCAPRRSPRSTRRRARCRRARHREGHRERQGAPSFATTARSCASSSPAPLAAGAELVLAIDVLGLAAPRPLLRRARRRLPAQADAGVDAGPGRRLALLVPVLRLAERKGDERGHGHGARNDVRGVERHARLRQDDAATSARCTGGSTCRTARTSSRCASATSRRSRPSGTTRRSCTTSSAVAKPPPSARSRARPRCSSCSRSEFGVPYPYPRYAQVFVADFIFGGMENTSATTLTDTVLLDERAAIDLRRRLAGLARARASMVRRSRDVPRLGRRLAQRRLRDVLRVPVARAPRGPRRRRSRARRLGRGVLRRGRAAAIAARSRPSSTTSRSTSSITTSTRRAAASCTCCATCSATTRSGARSRTT